MTKKVVVFGATGTVGAYTCLYLRERCYEVIAIGSRKSDDGFFADYGIPFYSVDIRDEDSFSKLPQKDVFAVVHLAGLLPARMKGYEPQRYIDINITGSMNVWNYCSRVQAQRVIYSQSISDIANLCGTAEPIQADAPTSFPLDNDHSVYSITKNAARDLLIHHAARHHFNYYILRFPNIYLYHPNPMYYVDGALQWQGYRLMIHKAMRGEPLGIWGDPSKVRDMVYVKDCCQIIERCIGAEHPASGTYNVGTGKGTSLEEQVRGIVEVFSPTNAPSPITYDPQKPDAAEYIFDISKTKKELGYVPQYDYMAYLQDFKKERELQRFQKLWGTEQDCIQT